MTQRDINPYRYSDSNKRYMTYDWYLKHRFGGKVAKVSLDIGATCPNIDGTKGCGGCIYCKNGSSGVQGLSHSAPELPPLEEQYRAGVEAACRKWHPVGYIPYLQAHTNTYGDPRHLREMYLQCASLPGAVMLHIATRADCIDGDTLASLREVLHRLPVMVELGLQTTNDATAERINRCHTWTDFQKGYASLRTLQNEGLMIGVHLIDGLPGETADDMRRTAEEVAQLEPDMVKIHLLHVLSGTRLASLYECGAYTPMTREEYVSIVCDQLERLPEKTIIGRVTGDGMAKDLLAPLWSKRKTEVANEIDKELYRRGSWQGRKQSGPMQNTSPPSPIGTKSNG